MSQTLKFHIQTNWPPLYKELLIMIESPSKRPTNQSICIIGSTEISTNPYLYAS